MITLDTIMSTDPCPDYPRERVAELLGGSDRTTTIQEIARDDRVPAEDRIWILCRLQPKIAVDFAWWCAARAADAAARAAAADDASDAASAAARAADASAWSASAAARAADAADAADAAAAAERDAQCEWWSLVADGAAMPGVAVVRGRP